MSVSQLDVARASAFLLVLVEIVCVLCLFLADQLVALYFREKSSIFLLCYLFEVSRVSR